MAFNYIVATIKDWNISNYYNNINSMPGNWYLIQNKEELTLQNINNIKPRYIFFPHWSWIVPCEIVQSYVCVCFHMTDLPYGRGGSPLQNLIINGHKETKLTALKMTEELDAGPIFYKEKLSLSGTASEIFKSASDLTFDMIKKIVKNEPVPYEQEGKITYFKRRTPADSMLPNFTEIEKLFDFINMLDAKSYPKAFINHGNFKIEFEQASLNNDGTLNAKVNFIDLAKS